VVALAARVGGKPAVIAATTPAARDAGVKAGALAKQAAATLGGGGGGKDDLAQGGGSDATAIGAALDGIRAALKG
jgi:alanyl-tRNA synthetase